jgi:division protein CdvB (Snf7/Vps24/ESCRT-III family)
MALKIGEDQPVQMPMKTVISLIIIVALGTMGYFQIVERLNITDTKIKIMEKDLEENTEFRIKWPRGEMGSLPADSEQFMMLEDLYKTTDKINKHIESMMNNRINIEFLQKQMDKVLKDIETLKDKNREIIYKNGNK